VICPPFTRLQLFIPVAQVNVESKADPPLSKPEPEDAEMVIVAAETRLKVIGFPNASDTETASGLLPAPAGNSPDLVAPATVAVPK